jgi:signal transduction histidine kinase
MAQITTIKSKLTIGFFSIASLVVIVGTIGFVNSLHVNSAFHVVTNDTLPNLLALSDIQSSINKVSSYIVGFALVSPGAKSLHQERLQQMINDDKILTTYTDQFGKLIQPDEMQSYKLLKYLTAAYVTASLQLINSKANGMDEQSILNMIRSTDRMSAQISVIIDNIMNVEKSGLQNQIARADDAIRIQQIELILSSIGVFMLSLFIGRRMSYSIIKPLSTLKDAASQIAHGNLDFEMKCYAQFDEIGELSTQFDRMRQALNQRTRELQTSNTQLSLANAKLKEHDKVQQDFINIAAHELRTPIQPLLLASAELKNLMPNDERVSIIFRNTKKLQNLASAILDASRIESNTLQIDKKENVNLKDIIQDALKEIEYSHNDKLEVVYEPKDIFIVADKDRITEVISNLLSNALKFTKEGKISVNVKQENINKEVIVSIKDTGCGIDREMRSKLFTKFATTSFEGTGLGLYISRNIIEAHGGTMWVNNDDGTNGATFSFSIPKSYL